MSSLAVERVLPVSPLC
jgi:protein phosphatase 1 regulatory subunit 7